MFKFNKKKNVIIATSLLAVASLLIGSKMYFKDSRTIVTQRGEYQSKNVISDNNMTLSLSSLFDKILGIFSGSKLKADKEVTMDSTNVCKFAEATGKSADS